MLGPSSVKPYWGPFSFLSAKKKPPQGAAAVVSCIFPTL
nr:MAG TPA: hypothetical protein [Caudoviricetes sp.]